MKITLKGNTAKKTKRFFPATDTKPAMLYFDVADTILKRDKSKKTIWYHCVATREYAVTLYRLLHEDAEISRKVQVEGRVVDEPEVRVDPKTKQATATVKIWVDDVDFLDDKRPETDPVPQAEPDDETEPGEEVDGDADPTDPF